MRTTPRAVIALLATAATAAGGLVAASGTAAAGPPSPSGPRPAIDRQLSRTIDTTGSASVIVVLRGHAATAHPDTRRGAAAHSAAVRGVQAPVLSLLARSGGARQVHAYKAFSMVSARVSKAGLQALAASPDVASVVPNSRISSGFTPQTARATGSAAIGRTVPPGTCSTDPAKPQLNPQALQTTATDSDVPGAKTARSLGATGAGVKVAFMAEGIDVNNPDFIRPDGSKVFTDYQDFSGDGTSAPTAAGEAFIDGGSIGAQGNETYNVQNYSSIPLAKPCYIKVEGVAPGASLVDLKVFGENEFGTTSNFLQAIDYAVDTDHVDVLSQSFGNNGTPDTAVDVIRQADAAANAAGVTVVASSGDAGVTSTIGSPASQPGVLSVGATTTYRFSLQTGYGGAQFPGITGQLSDNISSLSSGGTTTQGRSVDLSAPGELNWGLCSEDTQQYFDCVSLAGDPSNLEDAGGTSESAPLVAGGAALVIQAYRQTHGGASPSPALIKKILVSTARDIHAPADQQGAGELDSYRAVLAARSVASADGRPAAQGDSTLTSTGQIDIQGAPGAAVSRRITIANTGANTQTVHVAPRTLTQWSAFHQQTATLSASSPTSKDYQGFVDPYAKLHFTVPAGQQRLDASIAYQAASFALASRGRLVLIDPSGKIADYSLPQGVGNYGDAQVDKPAAGTWTAYIWTRPAAAGGSLGKYVFGWRTANYVGYGSVSPSTLTLAPGKSGTVTYSAGLPASPGDRAVSLVVASSGAGVSTIPVVLRSYIPLSTKGTTFSQLLTGGNGRASFTGQAFYYQFRVGAGTSALTALVKLANNPNNPVYISLIDPHGDQVGYGSNVFQSSLTAQPTLGLSGAAQAIARTPGTWNLVVNFAGFVSGTALSQPFSVHLDSAAPTASAAGLPNSADTALPAGKPTTVNLHVTNTTGAPQAYFVDGRLDGLTTYTLDGDGTDQTLPLTTSEPIWIVPTETTSVTQSLQATVPVQFDYSWATGDPDLESDSAGRTAAGTYTAPSVPQGEWFQVPAEIGPFGAVGAPRATSTSAMTARTRAFDGAVSSPTGDLWTTSLNLNADPGTPIVVQPGHSATIPVTITPRGRAGSTVSGTLFLDALTSQTNFGEAPNGNEVAALPYRYTIGS